MPKGKVGNPNIANEAKKAWKQWQKWQSGNPAGRPKKGIYFVNSELIKEWYLPAKRQDIEETYMTMVQLESAKLKEFVNDSTKPMMIRIVAKSMLSWKGFEIIERMIDRAHWTAVRKTEEANPNQVTVALSKQEEQYLGIIFWDDDPEEDPEEEEKPKKKTGKKS